MNHTLTDILTGAATIYGEARGSTHADRVAVAHTILNRCRARDWFGLAPDYTPHSISAVCRRSRQFSCWNAGDPNQPALMKFMADHDAAVGDPVFRGCLRAMLDAIDRVMPDDTGGATHYMTTSLHKSAAAPAWAKGKQFVEIGAHRFFRGVA